MQLEAYHVIVTVLCSFINLCFVFTLLRKFYPKYLSHPLIKAFIMKCLIIVRQSLAIVRYFFV